MTKGGANVLEKSKGVRNPDGLPLKMTKASANVPEALGFPGRMRSPTPSIRIDDPHRAFRRVDQGGAAGCSEPPWRNATALERFSGRQDRQVQFGCAGEHARHTAEMRVRTPVKKVARRPHVTITVRGIIFDTGRRVGERVVHALRGLSQCTT